MASVSTTVTLSQAPSGGVLVPGGKATVNNTQLDSGSLATLQANIQTQSDKRYVQQGALFANVKDYGAKGDGTTDDTAAFQSALNALSTSGTLYLPPAVYVVGALTVSASYATITGSRAATLKLKAAANASLLSTPNDGTQRNGLRLVGFTMDGNAANQTGTSPLVDIYGMDDLVIDRMYIANPRGAGIRVGNGGAAGCLNPYIVNTLLRGDQTNSQGPGIDLESKSSDAHLDGLDIGYFKNDAAILLSSHIGAMISNTDAWQCKFGYHLYASHRTRVSNSLSDLALYHGFFCQNSNDLQLSNCQARESSQSGSGTNDGFYFEGVSGTPATDIVLTGCRAMGALQRYGINLGAYVTRGISVASMLNGNLTGTSNIASTCASCSIT